MSKKETNGTLLARIDERLKNLITSNDKEHKDIASAISELCQSTNHKVGGLEDRLRKLEDKTLGDENKYKGRMQFFKWLSLGLGILLGLVGVLDAIGII